MSLVPIVIEESPKVNVRLIFIRAFCGTELLWCLDQSKQIWRIP